MESNKGWSLIMTRGLISLMTCLSTALIQSLRQDISHFETQRVLVRVLCVIIVTLEAASETQLFLHWQDWAKSIAEPIVIISICVKT